VVDTLWRRGERLAKGIDNSINELKLHGHFELIGRPCCTVFATRDQEKKPSQEFRALFIQELIKRGVLAPSLIVSFSHSESDIDATVEAVDGALGVYRRALTDGASKYLVGRPVKPVFRRHN
jgi:glutamate-1-semialdehyde 2,1-aminomutase